MRAWIFITCCSLMSFTGCCTLVPVIAASPNTKGASLSRQEQTFAEALAHYGQGLLCEAKEGRDSKAALAHFQAAAKADPGNHALHTRVAVIALQRDDLDVAIEALEASYANDSKSIERCVDLAAIYQTAERIDDAISYYHKALHLNDSRGGIYVALARLYFQQQADEKALRLLKRGKKKAANANMIPIFLYEQAKQFVAHKDITRAIPCFERLAEWDPARRPQFYHLLGKLHLAKGNRAAAIEVLSRAIERPNPLPESFIHLAGIHMEADLPRAEEILKAGLEKRGDNPALLFTLGCLYSDSDRHADAIPLFEKAHKHAQTMTAADKHPAILTEIFYLYQGVAYERTGQLEKAERILEECITYYPKPHRALNYLAYTWAVAERNLDKALQYAKRALKLVPESAAYHDTLGWIYFKKKHLEKARDAIEKARGLADGNAEILDHLGDIYDALGNTEKAVSCWRESYAQDSDSPDVRQKLEDAGVTIEK